MSGSSHIAPRPTARPACKDAYIVNTARGGMIDEDTLIKRLESGEIGGAGLDAYEHEPAVNPKLARQGRKGRAAAAYGLGHHRRPGSMRSPSSVRASRGPVGIVPE